MAARKSVGPGRKLLALASAGSAALLVGWLVWWGKPPQMGGDREAAKSVDALFTAVTARDGGLLGRCEERLHAHRDSGNLRPEASAYLDGIIREARTGSWEAAAERLYAFMKAQRRELMRGQPKANG